MARGRGTNVFAVIFKGVSESANGRIYWRSQMWALIGGPFDKRRITNTSLIGSERAPEGQLLNADKTAVLVRSKCTANCPSPPVSGVYKGDRGFFSTPYSVCRKCPNYLASGRGRVRYARCALLRDKQPAIKAATEFVSIVNSAVETANEVLGR